MEAKFKPRKLKSQETLDKLTAGYFEEIRHAPENGILVASCSPVFPLDIFRAMGILTLVNTNRSAAYGSARISTGFCESAEACGYSPDLCSYPRTDLGAFLCEDEKRKNPLGLPIPNIVASTSQCHTMPKWSDIMSNMFNIPHVFLETPCLYDGTSQEEAVQAKEYIKKQLLDLISFLEDLTGRRFDYDRLGECMEYTSRQSALWGEIQGMTATIPSPMSSLDAMIHFAPLLTLRGSPQGVTYYEQLKEEVGERVKQKIGALPDERFRLHFHGPPAWFALSNLFSMFAVRGACLVSVFYSAVFNFELFDSSRPLDSIAEVLLRNWVNVGLEGRIAPIIKMMNEYHLDGMVVQRPRSCGMRGVFWDFDKAVEQQTGKPCTAFESDMCDSRLHSEAEIAQRVEAYLEILESRYQRS